MFKFLMVLFAIVAVALAGANPDANPDAKAEAKANPKPQFVYGGYTPYAAYAAPAVVPAAYTYY